MKNRLRVLVPGKSAIMVAIVFGMVAVASSVWSQSTTHIQKNIPPIPNSPNARYIAITPPTDNWASSCVWVLDTVTGKVQAYRIFIHLEANSGGSYSYFVRLPEFKPEFKSAPPAGYKDSGKTSGGKAVWLSPDGKQAWIAE